MTSNGVTRNPTAIALATTETHSSGLKNPFPAWSARLNTKFPAKPPSVKQQNPFAPIHAPTAGSTMRFISNRNPKPV